MFYKGWYILRMITIIIFLLAAACLNWEKLVSSSSAGSFCHLTELLPSNAQHFILRKKSNHCEMSGKPDKPVESRALTS